MKPHTWINFAFPALLLLAGLAFAVFVNYLDPRTNWVIAMFSPQTKTPFLAAAPYATALAADVPQINAVIAYVPDPQKRAALAEHATLIDPAGVPLCAPR